MDWMEVVSLMLERAPGGNRGLGGAVRQKQRRSPDPKRRAPTLRLPGGWRRLPPARVARGCALFSALPRRDCSAGGSGRRAGRLCLAGRVSEPSGSRPVQHKPTVRRAGVSRCLRCPALRFSGMTSTSTTGATEGAPAPEMLCRGFPARIGPFPSLLFGVGRGKRSWSRWLGRCESVSSAPRFAGAAFPKTPSTKSAPGRASRFPPAPHLAGQPPDFTPGQGHGWAFLAVQSTVYFFAKRRAKRRGKTMFPSHGRQSLRESRGPQPASASRASAWLRPGPGLVPAGRRRVSLPNRAQPGSSSCRHVPAPARSLVVLFN